MLNHHLSQKLNIMKKKKNDEFSNLTNILRKCHLLPLIWGKKNAFPSLFDTHILLFYKLQKKLLIYIYIYA
jgi:hypothetical protein